jgi:hypothetical protein
LAYLQIESCLKAEEAQGVARMRGNQGVELVEVAFGLRNKERQRPVLSNDM